MDYEYMRESFFEHVGGNLFIESGTSDKVTAAYKECMEALHEYKKLINDLDKVNKKLKHKIETEDDIPEKYRRIYTASQECINSSRESYKKFEKDIKNMRSTMNIEGLQFTTSGIRFAIKTVENQITMTKKIINE